MKLIIDIESNNEAMHTDGVIDCLHDVINDIGNGEKSGIIRDENGNTVGTFMYESELRW